MTYNPGIPQAGDLPSASQPQILTNFQQINTLFGTNGDHYPFDNAIVALRGKHKFVTFQDQAAGPATAVNQMALYTKTTAGASTLYLRRPGSGTEIQMSTQDNPVNAIEGQSFLPGGLTIKWGQFLMAGNPDTHAYPIPFSTNSQNVTLCRYGGVSTNVVSVSGWTANGFTVQASGGATSIAYIAIGF